MISKISVLIIILHNFELTFNNELLDPWSRLEKSCFNRLCFLAGAQGGGRQLQLSCALLPPASSIATSWTESTTEGDGSTGREEQGRSSRTIADAPSDSSKFFKLLQLLAGSDTRPATIASGNCNKSGQVQSTSGTNS